MNWCDLIIGNLSDIALARYARNNYTLKIEGILFKKKKSKNKFRRDASPMAY